jgi:hypothetical protein
MWWQRVVDCLFGSCNAHNSLFLETVSNNRPTKSDCWQIEMMVNNRPIQFRIDTGADATVLGADVFDAEFNVALDPVDKQLVGPNRAKL